MVERVLRMHEAGGSIPPTSTFFFVNVTGNGTGTTLVASILSVRELYLGCSRIAVELC